MQTFYLMCGIPASGKSTVAQHIAQKTNAVIISSDEIRRELYSGQEYDPEQNRETFKVLGQRFRATLKTGQNVIIDAVNRRPSERKKYEASAKKQGYCTICVFCEKSCENAIRANHSRPKEKRIPDGVIRLNDAAFTDYFTAPRQKEGWNKFWTVDGDSFHNGGFSKPRWWQGLNP